MGSHKLIEVDRLGKVPSTFDLTNVLSHHPIEGVTGDENGTIYLVGRKYRVVLYVSVPEPETCAMMLAGLGLVGCCGSSS